MSWIIIINGHQFGSAKQHYIVDPNDFMTKEDQTWLIESVDPSCCSPYSIRKIIERAYQGKHPEYETEDMSKVFCPEYPKAKFVSCDLYYDAIDWLDTIAQYPPKTIERIIIIEFHDENS